MTPIPTIYYACLSTLDLHIAIKIYAENCTDWIKVECYIKQLYRALFYLYSFLVVIVRAVFALQKLNGLLLFVCILSSICSCVLMEIIPEYRITDLSAKVEWHSILITFVPPCLWSRTEILLSTVLFSKVPRLDPSNFKMYFYP